MESFASSKNAASKNSGQALTSPHAATPVWSDWSDWSECSKSCGTGIMTKRRRCVDQISGILMNHNEGGSSGCVGDGFEATTCAWEPCVPVQWSEWSAWSTCVAGCGFGRQDRTRTCDDDGEGRNDCVGVDTQGKICEGFPCASWGPWGSYTGCNATCDERGFEARGRVCFLDGEETSVCYGESRETRACEKRDCGTG